MIQTHETSVSTNSLILAFLFSVAFMIFSNFSICLSIESCVPNGSIESSLVSVDFCKTQTVTRMNFLSSIKNIND